jgi:autoinducer 2-degrading protein
MHIVHVHLKVQPARLDEFIRVTIENATRSLEEPGCVRFDVIQETEDPTSFELIEIYRDPAAHLAHRETPHYNAWAAVAPDMLREPRSRTVYSNVFPKDDAF